MKKTINILLILLFAGVLTSEIKSVDRACGDCKTSCDNNASESAERVTVGADCSDGCPSRTVFIPRQQTTDAMNELALNNYEIYHHTPCPEDKAFFHFQASWFYKKSTNDCELGRYFSPKHKSVISVEENGTGDIGSLWLGVIAPEEGTFFSSKLKLSPHRTLNGGYFNFFFDLNNWFCGTWFSISFAAMQAKQKLCLREFDIENPGNGTDVPGITDASSGLNNPAFNYGRFTNKTLCRTGVDDVQLKFGWNHYFCDLDHVGVYLVGTAPTGDNLRNRYIFEPVVGTRNGSIGFGVNTDWTFYNCRANTLNWMSDFKYRYVFGHCQKRSFDLKCKGDWSRFLLVVTPEETSNTLPGINFTTLQTDVTPKSTIEFWTALHYAYCENYNFELGYNLWWKGAEKLCIKKDIANVGIFDINDVCGTLISATENANITQTLSAAGTNFPEGDATFTPLTNGNLNKTSGTSPKALTNTIYGAFSYNRDCWCMPTMIGIGGSFEFASPKENAFEQWGVWIKTSISF